jgi:hypothetical protein
VFAYHRSLSPSQLTQQCIISIAETLEQLVRHCNTTRKVTVLIPDEVIAFSNLRNPYSRTVALGLTQPLTEMSTSNLHGGKGRPARKADKLTAISLEKM